MIGFIAEASSRHLTYYLPGIEEGAFGSYNGGGGFGRKNLGVALLQKSLDYTTLIETAVANASFYFDLTSPLYNEKSFPNATQFWRRYEDVSQEGDQEKKSKNKKKRAAAANDDSESSSIPYNQTIDYYRLNVGAYDPGSLSLMVSTLTSRVATGTVSFSTSTSTGAVKDNHTGLYNYSSAADSDSSTASCDKEDGKQKDVYDVIIVGSGIAGSSCYYWLSQKFNKKVLLLDKFGKDRNFSNTNSNRSQRSYRGSSGGGPRRIGMLELAPGARVRQAWQLWLSLQKEAKQYVNNQLLDVTGEVIVVNIFPLGWILMIAFLIWKFLRQLATLCCGNAHCLPNNLYLLFTSQMLQDKLPKCFKGKLGWNHFGVWYDEAAALRADPICNYLTSESSDKSSGNGSEVLDKVQVTDIKVNTEDNTTTVSCIRTTDSVDTAIEFKATHVILATGAGTVELLQQKLNIPCAAEVDTFVCPALSDTKTGSFEKSGIRIEDKCPMFAWPGANVYGFPVWAQEKGSKEQQQLYVRCNFPERTISTLLEDSESVSDGDNDLNELRKINKSTSDDNLLVVESGLSSKADLEQSQNAAVVRRFVREHLHESIVDSNSSSADYSTCRYVRLRIQKPVQSNSKSNSIDYYPSQQIMDFVPNTSNRIVLLSGLDGYGFKYGSLYGLEVGDLLYGSKLTPAGLEWPSIKQDQENGALAVFHGIIDKLLKSTGKNQSKSSASNASSSCPSFISRVTGGIKDVSVLVSENIDETMVLSGCLLVFMYWALTTDGNLQTFTLRITELLLHFVFVFLCVTYSLGSELTFRPVDELASVADKKSWWSQVGMIWGLHFGWGLGVPVLIHMIYTWLYGIGVVVSNDSSTVNQNLTSTRLFILLSSVLLNGSATLIRNASMCEFRQRAKGGVKFSQAYTRRVKIPGVSTGFFNEADTVLENQNQNQGVGVVKRVVSNDRKTNISGSSSRTSSNESDNSPAISTTASSTAQSPMKQGHSDESLLSTSTLSGQDSESPDKSDKTSSSISSDDEGQTTMKKQTSTTSEVLSSDDKDSSIVRSGTYALARHPGFSAHILQIVAMSIWWCGFQSTGNSSSQLYNCVIIVSLFTFFIAYSIFQGSATSEEKVMLDVDGTSEDKEETNNQRQETAQQYRSYKQEIPLRFNVIGLLAMPTSRQYIKIIRSILGERNEVLNMDLSLFTLTRDFLFSSMLFPISDTCENFARNVREGNSRQAFLWICGKTYGQRIEYLDVRNPADLSLVEKVLNSADKGAFIEDKIATPAWAPVRSLESVGHRESAALRVKLVAILEHLDRSEATIRKAVGIGMKAEMQKVIDAANGDSDYNGVFDNRCLAGATIRTMIWLITRLEMTEEDVELAINATEEWKATIAFKQPPKRPDLSLKTPYIAMIRRLLEESEYWQTEVMANLGTKAETDTDASDNSKSSSTITPTQSADTVTRTSSAPRTSMTSSPSTTFAANAAKSNIKWTSDSISDLSCLLQPFFISPTINFPDVFSATERIIREYHPGFVEKARDSLDMCDMIMLETLRCQHPFPIWERSVQQDVTSDVKTCPMSGSSSTTSSSSAASKCPYFRSIGKGTQVFIELDQYSSHVAKNDFKDFTPEKNWQEYVNYGEDMGYATQAWKELKKKGTCPYMVLPFGAGPRRCVGHKWARQIMKHQLHYLCSVFEFKEKLEKSDRKLLQGWEDFSSCKEELERPQLSWDKYLQPWVNHKYSGRNNDGNDSEEDLGYIVKRLCGMWSQFVFERVKQLKNM